jgi:hypothetical protein
VGRVVRQAEDSVSAMRGEAPLAAWPGPINGHGRTIAAPHAGPRGSPSRDNRFDPGIADPGVN